MIDSKHPEDFVEPPRRPRSARHTRNQSSTSQLSMSEDQSDSMDEDDSHHDSSVDLQSQNEAAWTTRARMSRQAHERQQIPGGQSGRPGRASADSSPQSIGGNLPSASINTHRKTRSSSATPMGRQRAPESRGKSPMLQGQPDLGSPALVPRQQFDLRHPQTGAKMPPQIKSEPAGNSPLTAGPSPQMQQHQQTMMQSLPTPGVGFRPKDHQVQQGQAAQRQYQMARYAMEQHGYSDGQSPNLTGGARPKLKVEIPQDVVNRSGGAPGGAAGNWVDNSISPSGYLLSSQIVPEPASRLPLGNGEKTPLSASLPSRYLNDMLPSPSNLFTNDWGAPWSGLPESAGGRRQGQPMGGQPSAGGQTPSMGMPSALPGLTPGGFSTTARGIAGDAALAMQAATQQYQNQQVRQHQQQLQMQMQQGQMSMQIPQSPPRSMGVGNVGGQRSETPPTKRHKPN